MQEKFKEDTMNPVLKFTTGGVAGAGGIAGSACLYNHITTVQEQEAEHQDLLKKNHNYGTLSGLIAKEDCKIKEVTILNKGSQNLGPGYLWKYLSPDYTKKLFDWLNASEENKKMAKCGISGEPVDLATRQGESQFWIKGTK